MTSRRKKSRKGGIQENGIAREVYDEVAIWVG